MCCVASSLARILSLFWLVWWLGICGDRLGTLLTLLLVEICVCNETCGLFIFFYLFSPCLDTLLVWILFCSVCTYRFFSFKKKKYCFCVRKAITWGQPLVIAPYNESVGLASFDSKFFSSISVSDACECHKVAHIVFMTFLPLRQISSNPRVFCRPSQV